MKGSFMRESKVGEGTHVENLNPPWGRLTLWVGKKKAPKNFAEEEM